MPGERLSVSADGSVFLCGATAATLAHLIRQARPEDRLPSGSAEILKTLDLAAGIYARHRAQKSDNENLRLEKAALERRLAAAEKIARELDDGLRLDSFTVNAAADRLGLTASRIRQLVRSGILESLMIGRNLHVTKDSLDREYRRRNG